MGRCDLNVPLDGKTITDDTRIRASVPTLKYLMDKGASIAVCSHLGRPKDGPEDKFSLAPCAARLGELLGKEVKMAGDCIGDAVSKLVSDAGEGEVILLENTRFYKEEEKNEESFVEKLAKPFDMFVNDAFGTAHRAHASTEGVTKFLSPSVSGFLLAKELEYLDGAIADGEKPMCAIVGGSKVSSKIPEGWMGLDNGPGTTAAQRAALSDCKTVIMNGPMGVFEMEQFAKGTFGLVDILADISKTGTVTIIGGGDSVAACEQSGRASEMSHISTGGGASLELLEGKVLPGV